ncbi:TetR/AcrR family transcriptional regulator C-terminal domain-containing protein [Nonomuraea sp. NPDC050691]|uniref:TetR/AcrR family transcriptional regulator C-terminal domain-containing protein n=1 Tax=Nonomuraea sp. NPDC050691 TaxID=3155661 RepID=UPI0033F90020
MPIDKETAARTALRLLEEDGLDRLTVRRVASALGVQAPALYWHFADKRALLDQIVDVMLAPAAMELGRPGPGEPWWTWLERSLGALRRALLAHRDGARVAAGADVTRAVAMGAFAERVTEVLHAAGFGLADASRAAGALVHFVVGRTLEEQSRPALEEEARAVADAGFPFPVLAAALRERHEAGITPDEDFAYSLMIMLTGLRALRDRSV